MSTKADLFGESDESSDESVEASKQTDNNDNSAAGETQSPEGHENEESGKEKSTSALSPSKNSTLFGDEESSSSDDDEFQDDGIVGTSGGGKAKSTADEKKTYDAGKTMNERLGLESDDEDKDTKTKDSESMEGRKVYKPPRKIELLDLAEETDRRVDADQITYHITKLPNLVGINYNPYNSSTHDAESEETHYRGYVHNMIRWRYKEDEDGEYLRDEQGNPIRESNTRLVKWSDGSFTLHVGNEVLEVDNLDSSVPADGFAGSNGYLYVSQKARIRPPTKRELEGPLGEDEVDDEPQPAAQPAGTVLECIGPMSSRLVPRPSSLTSDAHRNLKLAVQKRSAKRARIEEVVTEVDPEKEKLDRIRGKDDLARSKKRKSGGGGGGGRKKSRMSEQYLEDDDDEYDTVNTRRIKNRTMRRHSDGEEEEMDFGDSDESEDDEWTSSKKRKKGAAAAARAKQDDSSEEGEVVFGEESDDDEAMVTKKKGGGAKKTAVFDDDDDDE